MYKTVFLREFMPQYNNLGTEAKRKSLLSHAYNNYEVIDKGEYKGEIYYIVEDVKKDVKKKAETK
jgi:hypothetical protein